MALFCAKRDSVSLFRFRNHITVILCAISPVEIPLFFFPFLFSRFYCFLVCLYVDIVFFAFFYAFFKSLNCFIYAILNAGESSSSFFSWHIVCLCHLLCIVISLFVLWSICLRSSIVHFKKGPEYLTRETTQVFIHLMRFLQQSLVSTSSHSSSFLFFSLISACLMVFASNIFKYLQFLIFASVLVLSKFHNSILSVFIFCSLWVWHIFQSQIPFLYLGCIFF